MYLRKFLLFVIAIFLSPLTAAMSLGEGEILSHVGEPFSANIALLGGYSRDYGFFQVRNAECRSSIIGKTAGGCESLYEGPLHLTLRRRNDGRYYLRVTASKGDEFFYRILIKVTSPSGGAIFRTYEFLPEFNESSGAQPAVDDGVDVVPGKYGVVGGKIIEPVPDDVSPVVKKTTVAQVEKVPLPDVNSRKPETAEAVVKQPVQTRLHIQKFGEYADDIHALQKENGEIEEQIALLEKHIGLLKEVIRLKSEAGSAISSPVAVATQVPVRAPVSVQSPLAQPNNFSGILTWVLLGVVILLLAALGWMYIKINRMTLRNADQPQPPLPPLHSSSLNEIKSLDLTGAFIRPKW